MASSENGTGSSVFADPSPLALLVKAANAQSEEQVSKDVARPVQATSNPQEVGKTQEQRELAETALREAIQREAIEREVIERENLERELLQRRAVMMGMGGNGSLGIQAQEAEYIHQLRLEALVQQRRQETLARLALAQEMGTSQELQALMNAEQIRQATMLRQEMMQGGYPSSLEGSTLQENFLIQQHLAERERQAKLAALGLSPGSLAQAQIVGSSANLPTDLNLGQAAKLASTDDGRSVDSKTTVLPCRARGMPMDHNAKTAYFVVPEDVKHGAELVCSYYSCRNSGIKFRYCTYCKLPVAKRNFFKRHKHEGKIPESQMPKQDTPEEESDENVHEASLDTSTREKGPSKTEAENLLAELITQGAEVLKAIPDPSSSPDNEIENDHLIEERLERWNELLVERVQGKKVTLEWVKKVLAISDLHTACTATSPHTSRKQSLDGCDRREEKVLDEPNESGVQMSQSLGNECETVEMTTDEAVENGANTAVDIATTAIDSPKAATMDKDPYSDTESSSSDDSVDLRANKKARTVQ